MTQAEALDRIAPLLPRDATTITRAAIAVVEPEAAAHIDSLIRDGLVSANGRGDIRLSPRLALERYGLDLEY